MSSRLLRKFSSLSRVSTMKQSMNILQNPNSLWPARWENCNQLLKQYPEDIALKKYALNNIYGPVSDKSRSLALCSDLERLAPKVCCPYIYFQRKHYALVNITG